MLPIGEIVVMKGDLLMTDSDSNPIETVARSARRALFALLFMILILGGTLLSNVLRPDSPFSRWPSRAPWAIPIGVVIIVAASASGRRRWDPNAPEVRAVLKDEYRVTNFQKAIRVAFITILVAQVPLAFFFTSLPPFRAAMGMAVATITLAMITLITFFLIFDRG